MTNGFSRRGVSIRMLLPVFVGLLLTASGLSSHVLADPADPGCDDIRQLCKEATERATKCADDAKDAASKACKQLNDVRDASCTQAEIVCKPPVGEPG